MKIFSPDALVSFREEKGLSQSELAAKTGLSRQNIWQWENGSTVPHTSSLLKIVNCFGLPSMDIFFVDVYNHSDNKDITE
jgi:transcriptional regulator with XRE-family HTH domain